MLLPLYVLFTLVTWGSSYPLEEDVCYGTTYRMPAGFTPPLFNKTIKYTPKGGETKIVISHGQSLDARFRASWGRAEMFDVMEQDDGAVITNEGSYARLVTLRVRNCRGPVRKRYGSVVNWKIPSEAEYLEFLNYTGSGIPLSVKAKEIWNRNDPSKLIRGQIHGNSFEIRDITQDDNGYYRFMGSKKKLLKWEQIAIDYRVEKYDFDEGDIRLEYPIPLSPRRVMFTREGNDIAETLPDDDEYKKFKITKQYFEIDDATPEDAGKYEFFDMNGNLMLRATVEIREVEGVWGSYVVLAASLFGGMLCCCCVVKCCSKDSSNKTDETEDEAAPTPVYHHNPTQSTQTASPLLPREPTVIVPDLPTYNAQLGPLDPPPPYTECVAPPSAPPVPVYSSQAETPPVSTEPTANPPQPTTNDVVLADVSASLVDQESTAGAAGPTFFSSDNINFTSFNSEPTFEFSGTTFPSAPPLSSEGTASLEYNSDKLNFL